MSETTDQEHTHGTPTTTDPVEEALEAVEEIRGSLERVAASDNPFADEAAAILRDAARLRRERDDV